jgi:hypothetical protein
MMRNQRSSNGLNIEFKKKIIYPCSFYHHFLDLLGRWKYSFCCILEAKN